MRQEQLNERLSRISTLWTLLQQAHREPGDKAAAARQAVLQRYCGAVYHYLLGGVRDEDAARELFQEFAYRFVRGDFRRADPHRGRFRDYLKTALIHLVSDYRREQQARPGSLPSDSLAAPVVCEPEDEAFLGSWREELISRAWEALARSHATFHAVLRLRAEQPDLASPQAAAALEAQLGEPFSAGKVRVTLHRARERFAELLLNEVGASLAAPQETELVQELRELRLLGLCRPALERRRPGT